MSLEAAMLRLTKAQRARLEWCFEAGEPDYVKLSDGTYVGVHLEKVDHMEVVEREGSWATARKRPLD